MNNYKISFSKALKIGLLVLLGSSMLGHFLGSDKKIENERSNEGSKKAKVSKTSKDGKIYYDADGNEIDKSESEVGKNIQGIEAVDVYGNFEKKGFSVDKNIRADDATFINELTENGIEYRVETFCEGSATDVNEIDLNAMRTYPQFNKVEDMKAFLKYGCSLPYDGADIERVQKFIEENYYKNKASITISGVRFTIYVPTKFARMISIEKE